MNKESVRDNSVVKSAPSVCNSVDPKMCLPDRAQTWVANLVFGALGGIHFRLIWRGIQIYSYTPPRYLSPSPQNCLFVRIRSIHLFLKSISIVNVLVFWLMLWSQHPINKRNAINNRRCGVQCKPNQTNSSWSQHLHTYIYTYTECCAEARTCLRHC
jgi:hypothetical protein